MADQEVLAAWAAALAVLPEGWALSVTHVPDVDEWGCTASPARAPFSPIVQGQTARNEVDALRSIEAVLRSRS